jgi:RHS repeat-associated protein
LLGTVDAQVTITGSNFGAVQSNSKINFNGVNASVSNWSDTQITAIVPAGTTTGPIGVTVAGISAGGPNFTVLSTAQLTDSAGNVSNYTVAELGGTWHVVSSDGSGCSSCSMRGITQEDYDGSGNLLDSIDENNHKISYAYDGNQNVTSQSQALDANTNVNWTYTYNSFGEVLTATDPLNNVTTNTYDAKGNLLTVTTPKPDANTAASVTQFAYNALGELTTITDPLNHVTTLTYTSVGLIGTITDAQSNVTTYGYDAHGNRTSVTDAMQNQTTFAYDTGDRLTTITYPDRTTTVFGYDYRGRRTSVTDQNGKQTTYAYDDADRLTSVTDAAQHMTQYAYDDENNLTSITDANSHVTGFQYDPFGRVKETDFPSGHAESYTYDPIGNLITKLDRNGNAITYVYDALNRLKHKGYPDSTGVDYIYDLVGKIKSATDPTGTYGFAYDNMGRLIGTTTQYTFLPGNTYTNGYTYDAASNRTGFTAPDGSTNTYAYDSLNRLSTLTNSATGQFGFGYDALSRRTSLTRPNNVTTSYNYDSLSRLLSVLHQAGGVTIDGANYTLDNAGNRTSKINQLNGVTENYNYDPIYQLTQVQQVVSGSTNTTESYSYDAVGNRLSSFNVPSYSYNNSNELTSSADGYSYTYDFNGNTLTKADSTGTTQYAWDFENRLTSVTLPNGGVAVSFRYDLFGRRVQKSSTNGTTNYLYDGLDPVANAIERLDGNGTILSRFVQNRTDEHLAQVASGAVSYYEQDGLDSTSSLSDATGGLAQSYAYNTFGNLLTSAGIIDNPFQYTGRDFDPETGIYYYRARYYDSSIGRFISEDPIRFAGSSSFYLYTQNRPTNAVDPTGLKIKFCSRDAETMPGNHGFLYDTRNGDSCGKGRGNHPHGRENINDPGTFCYEIPGSDGREDAVMKCCREKTGSVWGIWGFFPWKHDCQNLAGDCLTQNGLSNPGAPGGRLGCRGGDCNVSYPFSASDPYGRYALTH